MASKRTQQPQIRRSVLVFGGVAVGVAVLGFVVMTFMGRGGGDAQAPSTQPETSQGPVATNAPKAPEGPVDLRPGGRDPFRPVVNTQAAAPAPAPAPTPAPTEASASAAAEGSRYVALVQAGKCQVLPAGGTYTPQEVLAHQNECLAANPS